MTRSSLLLALVLAGTPAVASACGGQEPSSPAPAAPAAAPAEVDVAALKAAMDAGEVALVDVRTPGEYAEGHAPGAVNIPLDQLSARMKELDAHREADLYLICLSGGRSGQARSQLAAAGFRSPINVAGGTRAWRAAGYPVE